jgi:hypothetical protein
MAARVGVGTSVFPGLSGPVEADAPYYMGNARANQKRQRDVPQSQRHALSDSRDDFGSPTTFQGEAICDPNYGERRSRFFKECEYSPIHPSTAFSPRDEARQWKQIYYGF